MKHLILLIICLASLSGSTQIFESEINLSVTLDSPQEVSAWDLDNDGDKDVLCVSETDNKIVWYPNNGDGSFGTQKEIIHNNQMVTSIYGADLDGDGDMDVLSGSYLDNTIAWYENDGAGNFGTPNIITTNILGVPSVRAADIDGDGDTDVLTASSFDSKVAWYENDGTGNFNQEFTISTEGIGANSIHTVDIDNDNDIDVLSSWGTSDQIFLHTNDGNGLFNVHEEITSQANGANSVFSGDLNGDGYIDIASSSRNDNKVAWYENLGNGNFSSQNNISTSAIGVNTISCSDLDDDGDLDVLSKSGQSVVWFENPGNGNFEQEVNLSFNSGVIEFIYSEDLNGDGNMDVLSISSSHDEIIYFENNGVGGFAEQLVNNDTNGAKYLNSADLDNDEDLDILGSSQDGKKVFWYENIGDGNFSPYNLISQNELDSEKPVYSVDIDGDNDLDILLKSNQAIWFENDGSGSFVQQTIVGEGANWDGSIFPEDIDNDGDIDFFANKIYANDGIWKYTNDGNGNFSQSQINTDNITLTNMFTSDINSNGFKDLVYSTSSSGISRIAWLENDGNGNLGPENIISVGDLLVHSRIGRADLNGDGDIDILAGSQIENKIVWYENDGFGNFSEPNQVFDDEELLSSFGNFKTGDTDGDGDIDIMATSSSKTTWYENDGTGIFGSESIILEHASRAYTDILAVDTDNDGDMDVLISSDRGDKRISFLENTLGDGCIDIDACNYDSEAWIDDGSCLYGNGCTDPMAVNYDNLAQCEDGSCLYHISGIVFFDENENGVQDAEEYGLSLQTITVEPLGIQLFTDNEGYFSFSGPPAELVITCGTTEAFPFVTTTQPLVVSNQEFEGELEIGISNQVAHFEIQVDLVSQENGFLCDDTLNFNIHYRNTGNVPLDGVIAFTHDDLFQGYEEITPIDSSEQTTVYMSFENLLPGEVRIYELTLFTPTVDHIGEFITNMATVTGYFEGEEVAFGEQEFTMEIACAYDPNDKQVFPPGYTEEHWILEETEPEFLIRFQNTGNAPAQNVHVQDTIDINFDLSTFRLAANSHSVMVTIYEDLRLVDFFFENIMLPDSVTNEPESHGFISYEIELEDNLAAGTVLENTAFIYFDNNEPIITNTTWSTIHECGGEAQFEVSALAICTGESVEFTASYLNIEDFEWIVGDSVFTTEPTFTEQFAEAGEYTIELNSENPLCSETNQQDITVYDYPVPDITENGTILSASTGDSYQWLINGNPIDGANSQNYEVIEDGTYSVIITNGSDCSNTSLEVIVLNINELRSKSIFLYPNPITSGAYLKFNDSSSRTIRILDSFGREVRRWNELYEAQLQILKEDLAPGNYTILVTEKDISNPYTIQFIVK